MIWWSCCTPVSRLVRHRSEMPVICDPRQNHAVDALNRNLSLGNRPTEQSDVLDCLGLRVVMFVELNQRRASILASRHGPPDEETVRELGNAFLVELATTLTLASPTDHSIFLADPSRV